MTTTRKSLPFAIKSVNPAQRMFTGEASNMAEDAMGDVIPPTALDLSRFRTNPVLLKDHDHHAAIGTVVRDWKTADGWWIEAQLFPEGVSAAADQAWNEIEAGGRRGLSIGFQGLASEPRTTSRGGSGVKWTKVQVLEVSSVNLPACPSCLVAGHKSIGCACGDVEVVVELADERDEVVDVDSQDVVRAVAQIVPGLIRAELGRHREAVIEIDEAAGFDPCANPADRAALLDAVRDVVPGLVRSTLNKLRGRID